MNHDQKVVEGLCPATLSFAFGAGSVLRAGSTFGAESAFRGGSAFTTCTAFTGGSGFVGSALLSAEISRFGSLGKIVALGLIMVGWAMDFAINSSALVLSSAACA